ncbi:MAG: hypothetical protein ACLUFL_01540 [Flavonifractor plautii]
MNNLSDALSSVITILGTAGGPAAGQKHPSAMAGWSISPDSHRGDHPVCRGKFRCDPVQKIITPDLPTTPC